MRRNLISKPVSQTLLLALIGAMALFFVTTLGMEMQETYLAGLSLVFIGVVLAFERLLPLHARWNRNDGDTAGDIGSFILIFGALDAGLKWVAPFLILALLPDAAFGLNLALWQEIILVFVLIEFGAWASHWAHHRYAPLWALHAMHHSPRRLYSLNNFRFHPFNHILNYAAMMALPLALGLSKDAVLAYTAITLPVLLLQHSNIAFDFGRLNLIFNTNAVHRWHHSTVPQEGTKNLGRALVIFDQLFGTFLLPGSPAEPKEIGLFSVSRSFPDASRFLQQLAWPFNPACCR